MYIVRMNGGYSQGGRGMPPTNTCTCTCTGNSNLLLTTWSLSGCSNFSRKPLLERRERLFNCSCLRSKLSCMGCMRAQRKSTHEKLIPSSLRLMALITFLPTTSRKLHVCVCVCVCVCSVMYKEEPPKFFSYESGHYAWS